MKSHSGPLRFLCFPRTTQNKDLGGNGEGLFPLSFPQNTDDPLSRARNVTVALLPQNFSCESIEKKEGKKKKKYNPFRLIIRLLIIVYKNRKTRQ